MRLNKNMYSLNIFRSYSNSLAKSSKALNNISTGKKINSAKDNPNKIGQNETLKINILSTQRAESNIQDTISMMQTYDGAMNEINSTLGRIRELTVQGSNGTLSDEDKKAAQGEADQLIEGLKDLVKNTAFNGVSISAGDSVSGLDVVMKKSQVGAIDGETIDIPFFNMSVENLGIDNIDISDGDTSLPIIDKAINMTSRMRGSYGAIQNSLEETAEAVSAKRVTIEGAQSSIGDADIAEEYIKYSTSGLLIQSSLSLIAQANNIPQDALQIIGNIPRG